METTFKVVFFLAVIIAAIVVIGLFLLGIKILLLFFPEINLLGVTLS